MNVPCFTYRQLPAGDGRRLAGLRFFVFKLGGPTGVARRLMFGWKGGFKLEQVRAAVLACHPDLVPAPGQLEDLFADMVAQKRLRIVCSNSHGTIYKIQHQPKFRPLVQVKPRQQKLPL